MGLHNTPSELAGQTVKIADWANDIGGQSIQIEDWWDRVAGGSWMTCDGNPACMGYGIRTGFSERRIPTDNEVLYGKIGALGVLVHMSEIDADTTTASADDHAAIEKEHQ